MKNTQKHFYDLIKSENELLEFKTHVQKRKYNEEIYGSIKSIIGEKLGFIPSIVGTMKSQQGIFHMWRARTLSSLKKYGQSDEQIESFSYPKVDWCTGYGRCNIPRHPVFYAASDAYTACKETRVNVGDLVYISYWNYIEGENLKFSNLLSKSNQEPTDRFKIFIDGYSSALTQLTPSWQDKKPNFELMNEILYEIFTEDDENYLYSSTIAHFNLFEINDIDFILYPSIQSNKKSFNFAVKPQNIQTEILNMEKIDLVKINAYEEGNKLSVSKIKTGKIENNQIKWDAATNK